MRPGLSFREGLGSIEALRKQVTRRRMLIGIDWGGTKIEGIAMSEEGHEILRLREVTPRGDYHGCIGIIVDLVARLERETGQAGSLGIGIPGSLEPRTRLGKGASSTWLLGQPVERTCFKRWGVPSALRTMPIAWRPPKPAMAPALASTSSSPSSWGAVSGGALLSLVARIMDPTTVRANGGTAPCPCRASARFLVAHATAASTAASKPMARVGPSRQSTRGTRVKSSRRPRSCSESVEASVLRACSGATTWTVSPAVSPSS